MQKVSNIPLVLKNFLKWKKTNMSGKMTIKKKMKVSDDKRMTSKIYRQEMAKVMSYNGSYKNAGKSRKEKRILKETSRTNTEHQLFGVVWSAGKGLD